MFNSQSYTLVTPPASEPVSLADVKTFLRIDGTDDDAVLAILIASARRMAEEYTKRAFITQTWKLVMDRFGGDTCAPVGNIAPYLAAGDQSIRLSRQPIQSITSVKTTDGLNATTTVLAATYALDTSGGIILLNEGYSWPSNLRDHAAVEVVYVAGWASAGAVPEPIRQGILQHIAASYTNKVCADIPEGSKSAYDAFRLPEAFGAF